MSSNDSFLPGVSEDYKTGYRHGNKMGKEYFITSGFRLGFNTAVESKSEKLIEHHEAYEILTSIDFDTTKESHSIEKREGQ